MVVRFLVGALIALVGCYDVPRPLCGFACGPDGECPDGYSCDDSVGDNRCHPTGVVPPPDLCETALDGTPDDPRPRVRSNSLRDEPFIDPTIQRIDVAFSQLVLGVDDTTFQVVRDDGQGVQGDVQSDGSGSSNMSFPINTLVAGHTYTLTLSGHIFDPDGYRLIPYSYSFDVVPDLPPSIVRRSPEVDETDVTVDPRMFLQLDDYVTDLDPSDFVMSRDGIEIETESDGEADQSIALVMKAAKQLAANTVYTLSVLPGFYDEGGNTFPGESWTFTTGADLEAPNLRYSVPDFRIHEEEVAVDRTIVVEFDEAVTPINSSTIRLETLDGILIDASLTYDADDFIVFLNPDLQLSPLTSYRVKFGPGIHDGADNSLLATGYTFSTGVDLVTPKVASTSPAAEATGAPRNTPLVVAFDELVMPPAADQISVSANSVPIDGATSVVSAWSWQFTPFAPLPANTVIRVEFVVTDQYGNSASYSYAFTTGA